MSPLLLLQIEHQEGTKATETRLWVVRGTECNSGLAAGKKAPPLFRTLSLGKLSDDIKLSLNLYSFFLLNSLATCSCSFAHAY
jgi:hypothetical protein